MSAASSFFVRLAVAAFLVSAHQVRAADGTWVTPAPPTGREGHAAVYDSFRDQILVLSGYDQAFRNDVWLLFPAASGWVKTETAGTPPPGLFGVTAAYDAARDRVLQFGGKTQSTYHADVWSLGNLSGVPTWSTLSVSGTKPTPRAGHDAVLDPSRDHLWVFGGVTSTIPGFLGDLWRLSLAGSPTWSLVTPSGGPGVRQGHSMVYDSIRDRILLFGGNDTTLFFNDVWSLSLSDPATWTLLTPGGAPPSPRTGHVAVYDPSGDRMIVAWGSEDLVELNDAWELTLSGTPTWNQIAPAGGPSGRHYATAVLHPPSNRIVLFGGVIGRFEKPNDTWALDLDATPTWYEIVPGTTAPAYRAHHTMVLDTAGDRLVTFGGSDINPPLFNDVWVNPSPYTGDWEALVPAGTPPVARIRHTAIADPLRGRMIVFGGSRFAPTVMLDDLWSLSFATPNVWSPVVAAGTAPSPRRGHSAIYDPVGDRMIVFGGRDASTVFNDTWTLSMSSPETWAPLAAVGPSPPPMHEHTAIYDPVANRMIVVGGVTTPTSTWALSLTGTPTWTEIAPGTPSVHEHTAVYDPTWHRMIVFGGSTNTLVWELSMTTDQWRVLDAEGTTLYRWFGHTALLDPDLKRMIVFAGYSSQARNDLVWLQLPQVDDVPPPVSSANRLELRLSPNPASGPITIQFALGSSAPALIRIVDIAGREVRSWSRVGAASLERVTWDGRATSGARVPPGIYLCTVESHGTRQTKRIAITR